MKETYRTPTLDEFIHGFVYEVYSEGYWEDSIEDFDGWYQYAFDKGFCWRDLEDIERELERGNIRVRL